MTGNISFGKNADYSKITDHSVKLAEKKDRMIKRRGEKEGEEESRNKIDFKIPNLLLLQEYKNDLVLANKLNAHPKIYSSIVTIESIIKELEAINEYN